MGETGHGMEYILKRMKISLSESVCGSSSTAISNHMNRFHRIGYHRVLDGIIITLYGLQHVLTSKNIADGTNSTHALFCIFGKTYWSI